MRSLDISLFDGFAATAPQAVQTTWEQFVFDTIAKGHETFACNAQTEEAFKKKALALSPVLYRPESHRGIAGVVKLDMAVLDFDSLDSEQSVIDLLLTLEREGLAALVWTTWKHGKLDPATGVARTRIRAALPLSESVTRGEWPQFFQALQARFPGIDPACKDAPRLHALPSCPEYRKDQAWVYEIKGNPLDVKTLLFSVPFAAPQERPEPTRTVISTIALKTFVTVLKRRKGTKSAVLAEALDNILRGDRWIEEGLKHETIRDLTYALTAEFPTHTAEAYRTIFTASCDDAGVPWSHVAELFDSGHAKHAGEIRGVLDKAFEQAQCDLVGAKVERFYTPTDVERFAKEAGCTVEEFHKRWLVQTEGGEALYAFTPRGYMGPFGPRAAGKGARQYLFPATGPGVALRTTSVNDKGEEVLTPVDTMVHKFGSLAKEVRASVKQSTTTYDGNCITEGLPRRNLEAKYDPQVDAWLRLLGGEHYSDLEKWVAWSYQLERPCVALAFTGAPGAGKTLLAHGLARMFRKGNATDLKKVVVGGFSHELMRCPIALSDESIPKDRNGRGLTEELRSIITDSSHSITIKGRPTMQLEGAVRVILTSNNRNIFEGVRAATEDDLKALARRILIIDVGEEPVKYMRDLQERGVRWADEIACHALWLSAQLPIPANAPDLLIHPHTSAGIENLASNSDEGQAILQWLIQVLTHNSMASALGDSAPYLRVREGQLYIHSNAIIEASKRYPHMQFMNQTGRVTRALATLCGERRRVSGKWLRPVRMDRLLKWADENDAATEEAINRGVRLIAALDQGKSIAPPAN